MKTLRFYFWAILFKVILETVYVYVVAPAYGYSGLYWLPNYEGMVISYLLYIVLMITVPKYKDRPSSQLVQLLFFTTYTPLSSYYWQTSQNPIYFILVSLCFWFLFLAIRFIRPVKIPFLDTTSKYKRKTIKYLDVFFFTFVLVLMFIAKYGIDVRAFNFSDVYEIRSEIVYEGLWGYLFNWISKVLLPFSIVMFLLKNRKIMAVVASLLQVMMYLSTGHKSILFSVILLLGCLFLLQKGRWDHGIPMFYSVVMLGSTLFYKVTGNLMAIALFPTRQLIIPAQVSYVHFDFFSQNQKLFLSESILGRLFDWQSPYNVHSTFLVSNNPNVNWNTGYLADAYDNFGAYGMIGYTMLLALIFLYIDSVSRASSQRFMYTAIAVYSIIILNDGSLLTTLITSGFGLILLFMYFVASKEYTIKSIVAEAAKISPKKKRRKRIVLRHPPKVKAVEWKESR